jgi:hypothetical protein
LAACVATVTSTIVGELQTEPGWFAIKIVTTIFVAAVFLVIIKAIS